jgi:hypothetical protein
MDNNLMEKLKAAMQRQPAPLEAARDFLQSYVSDADMAMLQRIVMRMMKTNPRTILDGLEGLEHVVRIAQEPGVLRDLVAYDANRSLDDPSDVGARAWLEALAARVRGWLGDQAPPPHD